ncbi:MAG: thiol peroxidase [Holophagales bacterium]|jgi:thiol peroxidase|nr:thiol peroxidase [Holophagales bacterium]
MTQVTLQGNPMNTIGSLPTVGSVIPNFTLVKTDLKEITKADIAGQKAVLNIFPSIDTPTCAMSVRAFNTKASQFKGAKVLCVSQDLPFAGARFCGAEDLTNVIPASAFRNPEFGKDFGVTLIDGPLKGLLARAVIVVDAQGAVLHSQLVSEIASEPDYEAALKAL